MLRRLPLIFVALFSLSPALAQEVREVPSTHQDKGLLYFSQGAIQAPASMKWFEVEEEGERKLFVGLPSEQRLNPDFFFNLVVEPSTAPTDENRARQLLLETNAGQRVNVTEVRKVKGGTELHYRLNQGVSGALRLTQLTKDRRLAVMGEGKKFDLASFQKTADSFKPGQQPPPEWSLRAPKPSELVAQNVVQLSAGALRVPEGFEWFAVANDPGQSVIGRRRDPFGLLAISLRADGVAPTAESGRSRSEEFLKSIDEEGLTFRLEEPVALSDPVANSLLFTVKAQSTGIVRSGRVCIAPLESQLLMVAALGIDDARLMSTVINSFRRVGPSTASTEKQSVLTRPEAFTSEQASETLVIVACVVFGFTALLATLAVWLKNRRSDAAPRNPFSIALKAMFLAFWLQQGVGVWLLLQNGGDLHDGLLLAGQVSLGFLGLIIPMAFLSWAWSRSR